MVPPADSTPGMARTAASSWSKKALRWARSGIFCFRQRDLNGQHISRIETWTHRAQIGEGAKHKSCAHQQEKSERQLRGHQHAAQLLPGKTGCGFSSCFTQGNTRASLRGDQGRRQAEQNGRQQRNQQSEAESNPIEMHITEVGESVRSQKAHDIQRAPSYQQPRRRSQSGEKQALRQQLPDDAGMSCSQRRAHRKLPLSRGSPRQQQVRYIDTGNQQNQSHCAHQQQQCRTGVAHQLLVQRQKLHLRSCQFFRGSLRILRHKRLRDGLQLRHRLLQWDTWFQARHHAHVIALALAPIRLGGKRKRHEGIRLELAGIDKVRRQDANDQCTQRCPGGATCPEHWD